MLEGAGCRGDATKQLRRSFFFRVRSFFLRVRSQVNRKGEVGKVVKRLTDFRFYLS